MDPRALRATRLKNEHRELMKLNGPVIEIEPLDFEPHAKYRITFNIRTIISPKPTYQSKTVCVLELPEGFPRDMPRLLIEQCSETVTPWHVNWYKGGTWCAGNWSSSEPLTNYIYRCAKTLQFDTLITRLESPANKDAIPFWNDNKKKVGIIPCDRQTLPTADAQAKISILNTAETKITIKSGN